MWIHEALTSPPRGMHWVLLSSWGRSFSFALSAVSLGHALDALSSLHGGMTFTSGGNWFGDWGLHESLAATIVAVILGSLCAYVTEALPPRLAGEQEKLWRSHVVGSVLKPEFSAPEQVTKHADGKGHGGGKSGHAHRSASNTGEGLLFDAATASVEQTANYRATFLAPTLASFSAPLIILVVWALWVDTKTALWLALFFISTPLIIIGAGKILRKSNATYRRKQAKATHAYLEMLEGLGTFKVLGAIDRVMTRFASQTRTAMAELTALLARNQLMIIVNDAVFGIAMSTTAIGLVLLRLQAGAISVGTALAGVFLSVLLYEPVNRVGRTFYIGLGGRTHRNGIVEMFGEPPAEASTAATAHSTDASAPQAPHAQHAPEISLRDVSVDIGEKRILSDINLTIPAGSRVGIVGPSGSGKSTLLRVLAGLQPHSGEVSLDGHALSTPELLANSLLISQQPAIFGTTVADNLRIACPDATAVDMRKALRDVHLLTEIEQRPGGLDSEVGDQGNWLSGGQRRRLAIARGLLGTAPIVLLDEPTADIDRRTEGLIKESLTRLAEGRTSIMVAHRMEALSDVDLVIVVAEGRIVAAGKPDELSTSNEYYARALTEES
ncbi:ABC transporter ATP-binding protein [Corynebacterium sp. HMSC074C11]|uniref:ATP-binding cassette domain-containing protein n=1 Tax=Corynebacterium sp. HMSC074C11 TaxID=1715093 RepID=UPI0008A41634|nr:MULTISPECIES: ABC transporter ATP-binding protein [unclassified Corynebacterium]MBC6758462.1 ABC transporter ATP-binding protein [Corynebacterium sp. LK24]OFN07413.1 lipid A export ATP-binding/permease MsbA [Corynebacterium sp. HMSC074C11]OFR92288.1 lipid A export ATP-binding/permease MsbA [Corynebacterium sp. HMSC064E10]